MKTVLFSNKKRRRAFIIISAAALLLITAVAVCAIYVSDYYRADEEAIEVFSEGGISWRQTQSGDIVFEPEVNATISEPCTMRQEGYFSPLIF